MNITSFFNYLDSAMEGHQTDALKLYYSDECNSMKRIYSVAEKLNKKDKALAKEKYIECINRCKALKHKCSKIGGHEDFILTKILSYINPLVMLVQSVEATQVIHGSNYSKYKVKTYDDILSLTAPNRMQRDVQRSFNIIINACQNKIKEIDYLLDGNFVEDEYTTIFIKFDS